MNIINIVNIEDDDPTVVRSYTQEAFLDMCNDKLYTNYTLEELPKADVLLTSHDRVKGTAEAELAADYAEALRKRMMGIALSDLADLCSEFIADRNPNKAAAFVDVASEILKLKEEK